MKNFIRIGIIGCGWIAENAHIPALMQESRCRLTALFDSDGARAEGMGKKWGIDSTFNNLEKFFKSGVEAVIIATPNGTHVHYTLEALKRGIHVLCEKPVAFHTNEMQQIMQVSKECNAIYIPGFVNRWREDIQNVYQIIQEKGIGKIQRMEAGWLRRAGVPRPGTWFTNRELAGGGVLVDLGSHIVDICLLLLGEREPVSYEMESSLCSMEKIKSIGEAGWFEREDARAFHVDVEDSVTASVGFQDDTKLRLKLSWLAPVKADCTYFRIYGTQGELRLQTLFGFSNDRLWENDVLEITQNGVKTKKIFNQDRKSAGNAFKKMLGYFVDSVLTHSTNFTDIRDAEKTVSLIENLYLVENRNM